MPAMDNIDRQQASMQERLDGVRESVIRGDAGGGEWASGVVTLLALALFLGACLRTLLLRHRWRSVLCHPVRGLYLTRGDADAWWRVVDHEVRARPEELVLGVDSFCAHLEGLRRRGLVSLVRRIHAAWLASPAGLTARTRGELVMGDHVVVRDEKGTLLVEGFLRTISTQEAMLVAYDEGAGWPEGSTERVYVEKANASCQRARLHERRGDALWLLAIGQAAELGHRREHYRVQADDFVLLFPATPRLAGIRRLVLSHEGPSHPLLARAMAAQSLRYAAEFERRGLWSGGATAQLEDLGAGGARVRIVGSHDDVPDGQALFLFLSFRLDSKAVELLLPCVTASGWEHCEIPSGLPAQRIRLRFDGMAAAEEAGLRHLIAKLAAHKLGQATPVVATVAAPASPHAPAAVS
jgi:hypothetical protein